jgi:Type IV secretion system pilin
MLKILKSSFFSVLLSFSVFSLVTIPTYSQSISDFQILKATTITDLINEIADFLFGLAPVLAGLVIIYGGYQYFLGGFDQKADGKKAIQSGVIGLAIVLSYKAIKELIINSFTTTGAFSNTAIIGFLTNITTSLITLSSIFAVGVIIFGGYKYMFSSLPGAKGDGKDAITKGIIGLVAIIIANPLIELITTFVTGTTPLNINTPAIQTFVLNIINNFLIPISSIATVFFFVIGGYFMLTSGGNDSQYKKGLSYLQNAVIGLVVILVSFTLTQIVIYVVQGVSFS